MNEVLKEFSWWYAFLILLFYILIDVLYVVYTLTVVKNKALASATCAGVMALIVSIGVVSYTHHNAYIVPVVLGSFIGTYLAVKLNKRWEK